jgi:3-phosphoinositide dependent protein kinase-1
MNSDSVSTLTRSGSTCHHRNPFKSSSQFVTIATDFVMNYAQNGELLPYINKVGSFDEECTRFYAAELLMALEHLHRLNIIHRDLKPENILLTKHMHIQITDFGSAYLSPVGLEQEEAEEEENEAQQKKLFEEKQQQRLLRKKRQDSEAIGTDDDDLSDTSNLNEEDTSKEEEEGELALASLPVEPDSPDDSGSSLASTSKALRSQKVEPTRPTMLSMPTGRTNGRQKATLRRRNSFVGTAQYVSPEMLTNKRACRSSDLWALGCIIYQMTAGLPPFRAPNEYLIFQKVVKLEYEYPDGFNATIRSLLEQLLCRHPGDRLGARDKSVFSADRDAGYRSIRAHPFFEPMRDRWRTLHNEQAPRILPYLPRNSNTEELRSQYKCMSPDELQPGLDDRQMNRLLSLALYENARVTAQKSILDISPIEFEQRLREQRDHNDWHCFVDNNLILKQGLIDKRKGLFARRRMFLLTTGPHLYYVDPVNRVLKGEIPWSEHLRPESKNFRIFFVHTVSALDSPLPTNY